MLVVRNGEVGLDDGTSFRADLLVNYQGNLVAVLVGRPRPLDGHLRARLAAAGVRVETILPAETIDPNLLELTLISRVLMAPAA